MMFRFDLGRAVRHADRHGRCLAALVALALLGGPALAGSECTGTGVTLRDVAALPATGAHLADRHPVRVLAIGSSSTEGIGASSPARAYPHQLEEDLTQAWREAPVAVVNAGIGGETADQTLLRLEAALAQPVKPSLVIWQVGTNDAVRGGDEGRFRALLERGIALVRAAGSDLILVDQQFYPAIPDRVRYERFVGLVAATAAENEVPVFSRYALMKEWGRQDPALLTSMLSADGFHMGDRGYDCLAEALSRVIVKAAAPAPAGAAVARAKRPTLPGLPTTRKG
ncbi:MAG: SGNH/GDSL hydrolase family protein [Methylobacterium sp.]|uniref:SGNH/GDSL hydrolase family protein n=1 Tax=Methylobacterium sp. TaxID=409 RepID=UPI002587E159|nr:SGNH/GDSL hydrolase family protein [Methylobacterium sp.]MBY0297207.1 SGNH/GDSL hydrolase family protein [Methylobacterium sp.]